MIEIIKLKYNEINDNVIICFHYAGGGANFFRNWIDYIPNNFNLLSVRLPGRENLLKYRAYCNLYDIIENLINHNEYTQLKNKKLYLFGHSMGALIAFELARYSQGWHIVKLNLSGLGHPKYIEPTKRYMLPDLALKQLVNVNDILGSPHAEELVDLLLPTIRSDYAVCDSYLYQERSKLNISINVFVGESDNIHQFHVASHWAQETNHDFFINIYEGDHFFIRQHYKEMIKEIVK